MNGKQLKNSILPWAKLGKLVPQDPNDEPASVLFSYVGSDVSFERAAFSSRSRQHTEQELLSLLRHYFATHTCLTRRILQRVAGLSDSTAKKWLQHLTATGVLQRDGASNAPVYLWRG